MLNGKKIVIVTPAGRQRYMEILFPYILREKDIVDEYRIWVNTKQNSDILYFESLEKKYENFVTLDRRYMDTEYCGDNRNIHNFFDICIEPNTIYIRLDDDVVWLSENFIRNLADYRIKNPKYFLVYPTIINNSICDYILQNLGYYNSYDNFEYDCINSIAFTSNQICEGKHREMLDAITESDRINDINNWVLRRYERVSINCISWLGETFSNFKGLVGIDEEQWLSYTKPNELKTPNVITGVSTCSHFAFGPQRDHMDKTEILEIYKKLSEYSTSINIQKIDFSNINWKEIPNKLKIKIHMILSGNNIKL